MKSLMFKNGNAYREQFFYFIIHKLRHNLFKKYPQLTVEYKRTHEETYIYIFNPEYMSKEEGFVQIFTSYIGELEIDNLLKEVVESENKNPLMSLSRQEIENKYKIKITSVV